VLVYTGRISYGWYLWHFPLIAMARDYTHSHWLEVLMLPLSYLIAVASYHFLEQPFLRMKQRFEPARAAPV
jgi:peptidoglycan/LPS O-acetylase OafA/YrhL